MLNLSNAIVLIPDRCKLLCFSSLLLLGPFALANTTPSEELGKHNTGPEIEHIEVKSKKILTLNFVIQQKLLS